MAMEVIAGILLLSIMQCRQIFFPCSLQNKEAVNQVYNIACGHQTSLLAVI